MAKSTEKLDNLEAALAQIEKAFGKGAIMKMNEDNIVHVDVVSTGSIGIDKATGVGGLPRGRIVEIYGPESSGKTTLTLSCIAQAQKQGLTCAFIDAENAFDPVYAKNLGVDVENLLVSQPDSGEQGLGICEALVESGGVDVVIVDSVAALVPQAEIDGDMGDSHMGLQARLMSQALRKITGKVKQNNVLCVFINQLRSKIGGYGCLQYHTPVLFADGRSIPIGKVVKEQITGEVWSFNEQTKQFEAKQIIDWHDNGKVESAEDYIFVASRNIYRNKKNYMNLTRNHKVLVIRDDKETWVEAKDLVVRDLIVSHEKVIAQCQALDFIKAVLFTGSKIETNRHGAPRINIRRVTLRDRDQEVAEAYETWRLKQLSFLSPRFDKSGNVFSTEHFDNLYNLQEKQQLELFGGSSVSDLAMSMLIFERGHYYNNRLQVRLWTNKSIGAKFAAMMCKSGFDCTIVKFKDHEYFDFSKPKEVLKKVLENIPKELVLKRFSVAKEFEKQVKGVKFYKQPELIIENRSIKSSVFAIKPMAAKFFEEDPTKYDISVDDNHNYVAGGVVVHNSPETTTGGNALKFYASMRIDIRGQTQIKEGDDVVGKETKVKIVKNKVAPPFREAQFQITFGKGFNQTQEILTWAIKYGLVTKSGAWYSYKDDKIGQGEAKTCQYLDDNPELRQELLDEIMNQK